MERAHALAREGAGEGTLVFAAKQTNGRGRLGRRWESPEGGAYFSLILKPTRPPAEIPQLSLVAGLSVAETIRKVTVTFRGGSVLEKGKVTVTFPSAPGSGGPGSASPAPIPTVSIRWPNDLLLDGKKVAGILVEAKDNAVVVGIGINVTTDPKDLPATATSLVEKVPGTFSEKSAWHLFPLVAAVCSRFDGWYDIWTAHGFPPIREALRPWLNLGGLVRLTTGDSEVEGQAMDVDDLGRLLVRLESGVTRVFEAGEVSLLR
ncbi:MAG: biotin--[acetyl-CoA-carboxylase] ligase [Candidatus Omnitrophica bacterium]|nr:biotin--[acetyl-CoA-carboxylase] ligase [Candidatus Omnitrophota bacterium]